MIFGGEILVLNQYIDREKIYVIPSLPRNLIKDTGFFGFVLDDNKKTGKKKPSANRWFNFFIIKPC